jgi:hypothetical protein
MKAIHGFLGLGLCLLGISYANAQAAKCSAVITKVSVTPNQSHEKTWDIQFNAAVKGCEMSGGTFEYVAEVQSSARTELQTVQETFNVEKSGNTRFTVAFHAPPGKELKEVRGVSVKSCTCIQ